MKKTISFIVLMIAAFATFVVAFHLEPPILQFWAEDNQTHDVYGFKVVPNTYFDHVFTEYPLVHCHAFADPPEFYLEGGRTDCVINPTGEHYDYFHAEVQWDYDSTETEKPDGFYISWKADAENGEHQQGVLYINST